VRELDWLMVYGRTGGIAIYELLDVAERGAVPPAWVALYNRGLAAYRSRNFSAATDFFQQVLDAKASDHPARMMLERCSQYLKSPPGDDWEATNAMKAK
jgi:adenylate cyclase